MATALDSDANIRGRERPCGHAGHALGAAYGLNAADATHLATAVCVGADRVVTNKRKDFGKDVAELDVVFPDEL